MKLTRREVDVLIRYYNEQAREAHLPEIVLEKHAADLPYRLYKKLDNGVSEISGLGCMPLHDVSCALWGMIFVLENVIRKQ